MQRNVTLIICLLIAVASGTAARAQTATDTAAAAATAAVLFSARVMIVSGDTVVIDRGAADGVTPGMAMTLVDFEQAKDADGNPLIPREVAAGQLEVTAVEESLCTARIVSADKPPITGMGVKYTLVVADTEGGAAAATASVNASSFASGTGEVRTVICPDDMQPVSGGAFTVRPGSLTDQDAAEKVELSEKTGDFCVDVWPQDEKMTWAEAYALCASEGRRLCTREEQHRTCILHGRRPRCPRGEECPRGTAIEDFSRVLEWSDAWKDNDMTGTGSCTCNGSTPSCTACYYTECGGAKKKFRCCKNPDQVIITEPGKAPEPKP